MIDLFFHHCSILDDNNITIMLLDPNVMISELARLMNCIELDDTVLQLCVKLLDEGVDPNQLANQIIAIKKETNSVLT